MPERDQLVAICLDRLTGQELWRHDVATPMRRPRDSRSTYASSSPVTDGQMVIFFYGNGKLAAFDFDGQEKWKRNIEEDYGPFAFQWTFSSTPLLHGGKLYLQVLQRDVPVGPYGLPDQENESYLLAMDPATGKTLWQHVRPSDAYMESREAFSSPIPFEHAGPPRNPRRRWRLPDRPRSRVGHGTVALGHLESRAHRPLAAGALARGWR